ncbi:MAG: hypothetical protein GTO24_21050 [candidate division Zixibacteria bacterium]|nr:hypothetical protein [candidate division Zixibacteria bacterium]
MKAILNDGTIVELEKDCGCTHHEGPHWLHMDKLDQRLNQKHFDNGNLRGFAQAEVARLNRKINEMEIRGIKELLND